MVETRRSTSKQARADADVPLKRGTNSVRRGGHSSLRRYAVAVIAIASGVGAAFAHTHSTGASVSDVLIAFVVGAGASLAASRAKPWAWAVASVLAVAGGGWPWALLACAAVAVCAVDAWLVTLPHRRVVGAAIGAVVVQVLLRMPTGRLAINTLIATAAVGCLVYSGRGAFARYVRGRRRPIAIVAAVVVLVPMGIVIVTALHVRHSVDTGIASAQQGLLAARQGKGAKAAKLFDQARASFHDANRELGGWWMKPALVVPGVGQQAQALDLLSGAGTDLAQVASSAARASNIDSLRVKDGRLDLNQVRAMSQPLASLQAALDRATRASVARRLALARAAHRAPARRVHDRSRQRALRRRHRHRGGRRPPRPTRWERTTAVLRHLRDTVRSARSRRVHGRVRRPHRGQGQARARQDRTGTRYSNIAGRGRKLTDPSAFPDRFRGFQPERFWQDVTATSDFPTVSEAVRQMWAQSGGTGPLDGVLYMDPMTLAAMMKLTGPVAVPGYDTPLTADNAVDFLLRGQYVAFPNDSRHDFQVDAAKTVFKKLTTGVLPQPSDIADALSPAIGERRLLFHSFHPEEQALFARLDVDGALRPDRWRLPVGAVVEPRLEQDRLVHAPDDHRRRRRRPVAEHRCRPR